MIFNIIGCNSASIFNIKFVKKRKIKFSLSIRGSAIYNIFIFKK